MGVGKRHIKWELVKDNKMGVGKRHMKWKEPSSRH